MCSEIDAVSIGRFDLGFGEFSGPTKEAGPTFHEAIFSQVSYHGSWPFTRSAFPQTTVSELMQKMRDIARGGNKFAPLMSKAGYSAGVKAEIEWGSDDGVEFNASCHGKFHDDKGNYVEVKVEQDSNGIGRASVSADHEAGSDQK